MADKATGARSDRVPITVRVAVPADLPRAELLGFLARHWDPELAVEFDPTYTPVPIQARKVRGDEPERERRQLLVVRASVDPRRLDAVRQQPYVDHVGRDVRVEPFDRPATAAEQLSVFSGAPGRVDCGGPGGAAGTAADVARMLGVTRLWAAGYTGRGVVVGVVDGGLTAHGRPLQGGAWPAVPHPPAHGRVVGGWPPEDWGTTAEGWGQHGNMIAFDVQAMAPEAELWDIRIWQAGAGFDEYVSRALQGYRLAIDHARAHGVPQILVNSWGLYDSSDGPDYAFDPNTDFVLLLEEALAAGLLVLFAAGNCGDGCPFTAGSPCGLGDRGPGASILGPNGHPGVMTVGAATLHGAWCGYTSQGPAVLPPNDPDKPDFCSISQFEGFFPNESGLRPYDGGTSAANGIAAGVVALLKEARPDLGPEECKQLLKDTARPLRTPAARGGAGAGLIDAFAAFRAL